MKEYVKTSDKQAFLLMQAKHAATVEAQYRQITLFVSNCTRNCFYNTFVMY